MRCKTKGNMNLAPPSFGLKDMQEHEEIASFVCALTAVRSTCSMRCCRRSKTRLHRLATFGTLGAVHGRQ